MEYEKPTIRSIDASSILEKLGPAVAVYSLRAGR